MHELIQNLHSKQLIWKGNRVEVPREFHCTGFSELDHRLGGGFPTSGVIDIQSPQGIGELRLLMPFVQKQASERLFVLINPPGYLCAEYLYAQGISPSQVLLLYPDSPQHALWAAEQCLKSGSCFAVLLWQQEIAVHQVKRLKQAALQGDAVQLLFRAKQCLDVPLPVSLSLALSPHQQGLAIEIKKQQGHWPQQAFVLDMQTQWPCLTQVPLANNVVPLSAMKAAKVG